MMSLSLHPSRVQDKIFLHCSYGKSTSTRKIYHFWYPLWEEELHRQMRNNFFTHLCVSSKAVNIVTLCAGSIFVWPWLATIWQSAVNGSRSEKEPTFFFTDSISDSDSGENGRLRQATSPALTPTPHKHCSHWLQSLWNASIVRCSNFGSSRMGDFCYCFLLAVDGTFLSRQTKECVLVTPLSTRVPERRWPSGGDNNGRTAPPPPIAGGQTDSGVAGQTAKAQVHTGDGGRQNAPVITNFPDLRQIHGIFGKSE